MYVVSGFSRTDIGARVAGCLDSAPPARHARPETNRSCLRRRAALWRPRPARFARHPPPRALMLAVSGFSGTVKAYVVSGFSGTVKAYVVSGFSRTRRGF